MKQKKQDINGSIQKIRNSTSSIITAWQLSSTLSNMESFVKYIQDFKQEKQCLKSILPFVNKIKKIEEEQIYFNKQVKLLLNEQNSQSSENNFTHKTEEKNNLNKQTLNKRQNKISQPQMKIKQLVNNLKKKNQQCEKKLIQIRKGIEITKKNKIQLKQKQNKKLSDDIDDYIKKQKQQLRLQIKNQQTLYNRKVFLNEKIKQIIQNKVHFDFIDQQKKFSYEEKQNLMKIDNKSQQNNYKSNNFNKILSFIDQKYVQIGEINCKLLSLQDKKRKITVKYLLDKYKSVQNKKKSQTIESQQKPFSHPKEYVSPHADVHYQQNKKKKEKNSHGFLKIISASKQINQKQDNFSKQVKQTQYQKQKVGSKLDITSQENKQYLKDQIILMIIQVKSQIFQLQQHIRIGFTDNIISKIRSSRYRIASINQQLKQVIQESIRLNIIFSNDKDNTQKQGLLPMNNEEYFQTNQIENNPHGHLNQLKQQQNNIQYSNSKKTYINFFINAIKEKLSERYKMMKNLFIQSRYSLVVLQKYIKKGIERIRLSVYEIQKQIDQYISQKRQNSNLLKYQYNELEKTVQRIQKQISNGYCAHIQTLVGYLNQRMQELEQRIRYLNQQVYRRKQVQDQQNLSVQQILQQNYVLEIKVIDSIFANNKNGNQQYLNLKKQSLMAIILDWHDQLQGNIAKIVSFKQQLNKFYLTN